MVMDAAVTATVAVKDRYDRSHHRYEPAIGDLTLLFIAAQAPRRKSKKELAASNSKTKTVNKKHQRPFVGPYRVIGYINRVIIQLIHVSTGKLVRAHTSRLWRVESLFNPTLLSHDDAPSDGMLEPATSSPDDASEISDDVDQAIPLPHSPSQRNAPPAISSPSPIPSPRSNSPVPRPQPANPSIAVSHPVPAAVDPQVIIKPIEEPPASPNSPTKTYHIDKIVDVRKTRTGIEFRVRWKNLSHHSDNWLPRESLLFDDQALKEELRRLPKDRRKKIPSSLLA
jgi:hypothetical protein